MSAHRTQGHRPHGHRQRARQHQVSPADRRFLRWLPLTLLLMKVPRAPDRLFRECPQLHRLRRAGLISVSFDASANALTLSRATPGTPALGDLFDGVGGEAEAG